MVTWRTVIGTHLKVGEARGCHAYHDHDRDHATGTSASCARLQSCFDAQPCTQRRHCDSGASVGQSPPFTWSVGVSHRRLPRATLLMLRHVPRPGRVASAVRARRRTRHIPEPLVLTRAGCSDWVFPGRWAEAGGYVGVAQSGGLVSGDDARPCVYGSGSRPATFWRATA
jgi:hypothetical protein